MEYDKRVIIKFLSNKGVNAPEIADRLQAQFGEHGYKSRTSQFWIREVRPGRQDLYHQIHIGRRPLFDLDAKSLAIRDKSAFELARSIAETLRIADLIVLLSLHDSIGFGSLHLH
jgi:hypothetical protein